MLRSLDLHIAYPQVINVPLGVMLVLTRIHMPHTLIVIISLFSTLMPQGRVLTQVTKARPIGDNIRYFVVNEVFVACTVLFFIACATR